MTSATIDSTRETGPFARENDDGGAVLVEWADGVTDLGPGNAGGGCFATSLDFDVSEASGLLGWTEAVRTSRARWARENPF